jgi:hypothetical protein
MTESDNYVPDNLPIPMTKLAYENLMTLQGHYQIKYKRKISLKALCTHIFETVTPKIL